MHWSILHTSGWYIYDWYVDLKSGTSCMYSHQFGDCRRLVWYISKYFVFDDSIRPFYRVPLRKWTWHFILVFLTCFYTNPCLEWWWRDLVIIYLHVISHLILSILLSLYEAAHFKTTDLFASKDRSFWLEFWQPWFFLTTLICVFYVLRIPPTAHYQTRSHKTVDKKCIQ